MGGSSAFLAKKKRTPPKNLVVFFIGGNMRKAPSVRAPSEAQAGSANGNGGFTHPISPPFCVITEQRHTEHTVSVSSLYVAQIFRFYKQKRNISKNSVS